MTEEQYKKIIKLKQSLTVAKKQMENAEVIWQNWRDSTSKKVTIEGSVYVSGHGKRSWSETLFLSPDTIHHLLTQNHVRLQSNYNALLRKFNKIQVYEDIC